MKILFVCETTNVSSGIGRYTHDLIEGIKKQGHEVSLFTDNNRGLGMFYSAWKLRKKLKGEHFDLIHAIDVNPAGSIAYLATRFRAVPYIVTALGTYAVAPLYHAKTKWLAARAYTNATNIAAMSAYTKQALQKAGVNKPIAVVQNGIKIEAFAQEHESSDESFILSVGALKRRKGYHIALPAFARVVKQMPNLRYKIVGGDPNKQPWVSDMVRNLGIEDKVDFLIGISDDELKQLYKTASVFLLPSVNDGQHFEGFGLVFLEAAAAGLPAIGTKGNGIEDAIQDGVTGTLVEQENIDMTADAILVMLQNNTQWEAMSAASHKWAQQHDISKTTQQYLTLYHETKSIHSIK